MRNINHVRISWRQNHFQRLWTKVPSSEQIFNTEWSIITEIFWQKQFSFLLGLIYNQPWWMGGKLSTGCWGAIQHFIICIIYYYYLVITQQAPAGLMRKCRMWTGVPKITSPITRTDTWQTCTSHYTVTCKSIQGVNETGVSFVDQDVWLSSLIRWPHYTCS